MTWNPEVSAVNQTTQIGAESTSALGTPVAANKLLQCFSFQFGVEADVAEHRPTGRKYSNTHIENTEWVSGSADGPIDYNGIIYALASACGSAAPAAHGSSATAKDWVFTPPLSGSVVPQTYSIEQGETATRAHKFAYALFTDIGYKGDRKSGLSFSGKLIGQPLSDGITMTTSPTAIALAPLAGKHLNIYLDSASANLGNTQLLKVLDIDFSMASIYGPFYPFNRANIGWTAHVDMPPKATVKLMMEADATGMTELSKLQAGTTQFLRVNGQGLVIDNLQIVSLGSPSAGTFTLTYKGQTTSALAYTATNSTVQTALVALSTIGTGNVTVTGSAGGPYSVVFGGTLAQDTTAMTGSGASLTGGTFLITQNQSYNVFQHDMAVQVSKPSPFSDKDGVYAIEWEFTVVEDGTWNKAHTFTITNLLTAL